MSFTLLVGLHCTQTHWCWILQFTLAFVSHTVSIVLSCLNIKHELGSQSYVCIQGTSAKLYTTSKKGFDGEDFKHLHVLPLLGDTSKKGLDRENFKRLHVLPALLGDTSKKVSSCSSSAGRHQQERVWWWGSCLSKNKNIIGEKGKGSSSWKWTKSPGFYSQWSLAFHFPLFLLHNISYSECLDGIPITIIWWHSMQWHSLCCDVIFDLKQTAQCI